MDGEKVRSGAYKIDYTRWWKTSEERGQRGRNFPCVSICICVRLSTVVRFVVE